MPAIEGIIHVPIESTRLDDAEAGGRNPVALVVADGDLIVRADAHPVGRAQAAGDDSKLRAILADLDDATVVRVSGVAEVAALGEIKVALRVGLQIQRELVDSWKAAMSLLKFS